MDNNTKKILTTTKMVAQFYIDMSKYLLVLLFAFGLFHEFEQSTIVRPILIIVAFVSLVSAGLRAERNMDKIEELEKKESQVTYQDDGK